MMRRIKGYLAIAGLIAIGFALGRSKSKKEIIYVVQRQ